MGALKRRKLLKPSGFDVKALQLIRQNVRVHLRCLARRLPTPARILDVAPQDWEGARSYFSNCRIDTLDVDPASGADFLADICANNRHLIPDNTYDLVVCTEVLEHVLRPWDAVAELFRITRPGGFLLLTTPFNFRIHGPLPDCWRFTEYGLRELLKDWEIRSLVSLETPGRPLMPIHYVVVCSKPVAGRDLPEPPQRPSNWIGK